MRKPVGAKKIIFSLLVALSGYLLLELFSCLLYSALNRELLSPRAFRSERTALLSAPAATVRPQEQHIKYYDHTLGDWQKNGRVFEVIHPYLGFVHDPTLMLSQNEFGFPGPDSPLAKRSARTLTVAIFGGSFAEQMAFYGGRALVAELQKSPEFSDRGIIIKTLALPGYKQPQQLFALAYFLTLGAEYDIAINLDGFNEVVLPPGENMSKGVHPIYPRSWLTRVEGYNDARMLKMIGHIYLLEKGRKRWAQLFSSSPLQYSFIANILWKYFDTEQANGKIAQEAELAQYKIEKTEKVNFLSSGPPFRYDGGPDLYSALADIWANSSLQMHRLCQANGIAYFHFLQPNQHLPGTKPMTRAERRKALNGASLHCLEGVREGYPRLIEKGKALRSQGVDFRDFTMIFSADQEVLYKDNACHLNEKGYTLIAQAIGRTIVAGPQDHAPGSE